MNTNAFFAILGAAFISTSAIAAMPPGISLSPDKKIVIIKGGVAKYTPPLAHERGLKTIYSNLATLYPNGTYFCCYGYTISGATSPIGEQIWLATAFTPATSMSVTEVDAAVGYVEGTNGIVLSLAKDAGGVPGAVLKSWNVGGLGTFGSCCTLATGKDKGGIPVTAGTQYWVTVTTSSKEANEWAAWPFNSTDMINTQVTASNTGSGWEASEALPGLSFGVYGK
jgi:hypothetical protein